MSRTLRGNIKRLYTKTRLGLTRRLLSTKKTDMPTNSSKSTTVILERIKEGDQGTFGKVRIEGSDLILFSGELPERDNIRSLSRIPSGRYDVDWTYSPKFKRYMYLLRDVGGRSGIRIHSANFVGDSLKGYRKQVYGCIALGLKLGVLDGQHAVLCSRPAVRKFETLLKHKSFTLEII